MRRHAVIEPHRGARTGWLRAAVLGANDGIVSTASLMVGVAAASSDHRQVLLAGLAGLVGGAMSMAAGEYISVSSQADIEKADLAIERQELKHFPDEERQELAAIYVERGLEPALAKQVADQLTARDALAAHARDELGINDYNAPRPVQAAMASAAAFACGAALPLLTALVAPARVGPTVMAVSLVCLAALGALAARAGGASMGKGAARVTFWSALAMALTAAVGHAFGVSVA
ncbi:VIT1/CCC1 family predicted Fe2+/Mn2+ transporter [Luteimonas cucumeris]|uniref:VIT1/CCC1 family predicted Fe2+/Mn2+ transporter n=1 Tax=Luteimonas cucumeris TaxID=985012 RepID=A0A562LB47_9GAMM|nr:VIT family protein [Luteimonas cucumeris]TWI04786.1 VIT1/CCC1 family predicted Fe2+/Mn2+ transporter [Luteimonas cucumeris]